MEDPPERSLPAEVSLWSCAHTDKGWQTRGAGRRICGEPQCRCSCDPHSADLGAWSPLGNTKESEKPEASSLSALQERAASGNFPAAFINLVI